MFISESAIYLFLQNSDIFIA